MLDVHRLTGAVKEDLLVSASKLTSSDKSIKVLLEKLALVKVESKNEEEPVAVPTEAQEIILEKGQSKDW